MEIEESSKIILNDIANLLLDKKIVDLTTHFDDSNKSQVTKIVKKFIYTHLPYNQETFETYNIIIKVVPVNENRKCHEAISFPFNSLYNIAFEEWDTDDRWEEAQLKQILKKTLILIPVIKIKKEGRYIGWKEWQISSCSIWKPNQKELSDIGIEWKKAQNTIKMGVNLVKEPFGKTYRTKNNLLKQSETNYLHLRPHGKDSFDLDKKYLEYTDGRVEITKQSFWLNKSFINTLLEKKYGQRF